MGGTATFNGGSGAITLATAGNDFQSIVNANNTGANAIAVTDTNAITLGTVTTANNLTVNAVGVSQNTGGLTVGGASTINGGSGPVTLTTATNDFTGTVSLTGGTTQITDANALALGTLATGGLTVTSTGALNLGQGSVGGPLVATSNNFAITQTGPLVVAGTTNVTAGAAPITLFSANDFQGDVTMSNTGSTNAVVITDINAISFTNLVLGGDFTVNGQTIDGHDTTNFGNQLWNGNVTFHSTETTNGGTFTVTGSTTLGANVTINASSGAVAFQGTVVGTTAGGEFLVVNSSGATTFGSTVGTALIPISSLTTDAGGSTVFNGNVFTGSAPGTVIPVTQQTILLGDPASDTGVSVPEGFGEEEEEETPPKKKN